MTLITSRIPSPGLSSHCIQRPSTAEHRAPFVASLLPSIWISKPNWYCTKPPHYAAILTHNGCNRASKRIYVATQRKLGAVARTRLNVSGKWPQSREAS
jgi:hypothetical protein